MNAKRFDSNLKLLQSQNYRNSVQIQIKKENYKKMSELIKTCEIS